MPEVVPQFASPSAFAISFYLLHLVCTYLAKLAPRFQACSLAFRSFIWICCLLWNGTLNEMSSWTLLFSWLNWTSSSVKVTIEDVCWYLKKAVKPFDLRFKSTLGSLMPHHLIASHIGPISPVQIPLACSLRPDLLIVFEGSRSLRCWCFACRWSVFASKEMCLEWMTEHQTYL